MQVIKRISEKLGISREQAFEVFKVMSGNGFDFSECTYPELDAAAEAVHKEMA